MLRTRWLLIAALLVGTSLPVGAADDDPATPAAQASLERLRALREQRPGDGLLAFYQAMAHAALGERDAALAELRGLLGRQLGLIPTKGIGFDPLWADAEFQALRSQLAAQEPPTPAAPVAFRLGDARMIPEGIAFDPHGRRFFIGSIAQRKIVVADRVGRVRDFSHPDDRLDTVLGLAVDPRRRVLYAVSTNGFDDGAKVERRNAVLRYDIARGRLAARHEVAAALQLNDVAVAPDGTIYVTDSAAGSLYRMRPGETAFAPFGPAQAARGANGIAVAPDGTVYVTLSTGIARLDGDGTPQLLVQPDSVVTGGIDGLYWHQGDLLGVQNVTNPGRVIRIRLADAGRRIDGIKVLQSHHHPAFDEPTTGAVADGSLHVLANTYVRRFQADGTLKDSDSLAPPIVIAVPLQGR
jgi:sugar lactone lactonase YvrE